MKQGVLVDNRPYDDRWTALIGYQFRPHIGRIPSLYKVTNIEHGEIIVHRQGQYRTWQGPWYFTPESFLQFLDITDAESCDTGRECVICEEPTANENDYLCCLCRLQEYEQAETDRILNRG